MRTVLLAGIALLVFLLTAFYGVTRQPQQTRAIPRTCLRSVQGFIPEHQGFWTTETGETISYAIPDQPTVHCVQWSE